MSEIHRRPKSPDDERNKMNGITLENITVNEWVQIKKEAIVILNAGTLGKDEFRCTIYGFVIWLLKNNKVLEIEGPAVDERVH